MTWPPNTHQDVQDEVTALRAAKGLLGAATFADASYGNGQGGIVGPNVGASFTQTTLDTAASNPGGYFDTATSVYNVPATGLYLLLGKLRLTDGSGTAGANLGMGVDPTIGDAPHFVWHTVGSALRKTFDYQRLATFTAGASLKMFTYYDGGTATVAAAQLTVLRVA